MSNINTLEFLTCNNNLISTIDLYDNVLLEEFRVNNNLLSSIDLINNKLPYIKSLTEKCYFY